MPVKYLIFNQWRPLATVKEIEELKHINALARPDAVQHYDNYKILLNFKKKPKIINPLQMAW